MIEINFAKEDISISPTKGVNSANENIPSHWQAIIQTDQIMVQLHNDSSGQIMMQFHRDLLQISSYETTLRTLIKGIGKINSRKTYRESSSLTKFLTRL